MALLFSIDLPLFLHLVLSKLCHEYIMKSIFVIFLADESRLPIDVYVRFRGTSSPSRSLGEPVHLSAFLFASFSNAYESNI